MTHRTILLTLFLASTALAGPPQPLAPAADRLEYNRDVRPILAENCFACHGPDSAARKANLRLDRRDDAVKAEAFVPNKPDDSAAIDRVFSDDPNEQMPPPTSRKKLTAAQKALLKRWVAEGTEYQPHWSFIPPKRPALPQVKNEAWVRNPIDRFILAELEKRGLSPAPEADRRTLARRLSLDLTGLPPDPADVEAFVNDARPDAYEKLVEKFLQSPHWGEHRGRFWLDAARYADTHGIHFDNFREIWAYRDWVINAFNKNQPFDQFTIEQLAGDLLPAATLDQKIATGFHRCNITTNEGGVIPEEYVVLYARDRTETTAAVWMGLTAGCAVCHDHKFDPLTMRDFYSMSAFFNNTTQGAMDGNVPNTPPVLVVPRAEERKRWEALEPELADVRGKLDAEKKQARGGFDKWAKETKPGKIYAAIPKDKLHFHALLAEGAGTTVTALIDGQLRQVTAEKPLAWEAGHVSAQAYKAKPDAVLAFDEVGDFEKDQPFAYGAWVRLPRNNLTGSVIARMDEANGHRGWDLWIENGRVGAHIVHNFPANWLKVVAGEQLKPNQWHHLFVSYDGSGKAAGLKLYVDGVPQDNRTTQSDTLTATIRTTTPLKVAQRSATGRLNDVGIEDVRIYERALPPAEVATLAGATRAGWLATKADKRSAQETDEFFAWWLPGNVPSYQKLVAQVRDLQKEGDGIKARGTVAHVMTERNGEPKAYVLFRGEYDKRRDEVKAATPAALPPFPQDLPHNRLGLAQWLLRPEHPLTARVTVNRFWQEVFGTGLVRTTGDFGVTGEQPSHPELLDWLAVEFREGGWDVKRFFTLLVTSAAYRQSAASTPEKREKDRDNRLLSRGPRYRLDAELIRDYALAASGLLAERVGGPSVKPYMPEGVWEAVAMIGSNTRDYRPDSGPNLYRRSMYTFWKRSAPPAAMEIFNAPSREVCTVRRERTNTPLQALVTLNDPQFIEAARYLAERTLKEGGDRTETRLDFVARRVLARPFRPEEAHVVLDSLNELVRYYQGAAADAKKLINVGESKPDATLDPATLAAWTMVVNEILNLDEALNK